MNAPPAPTGSIALPAEPRSTWPTVIGAVTIVFGILAVLQGACGTAGGLFFTTAISGAMPVAPSRTGDDPAAPGPNEGSDDAAKAMHRQMKGMYPLMLLTSAGGLLLGAAELTGGIGVCRRRRWGVHTLTGWAVAKSLFVIATTLMMAGWQHQLMGGMFADFGRTGGSPDADRYLQSFQAVMKWVAVLGAVVGIMFGLALPVFLLIWFNRTGVRSEIAAWGSGTPQSASAQNAAP